jgi:hypothetical protein
MPAPDDPRSAFLAEHALIRTSLLAIADLAHQVGGGRIELLATLQSEAEEMISQLRAHMNREERQVETALALDEREFRERFTQEHEEQRALLDHVSADVGDPRRPAQLLGRELTDFVRCLLEDMEWEERALLPLLGVSAATGRADSVCSV